MAQSGGEEERWRQYVSSLSILIVAVFIGLPLWWKTTEVYRCPLPYSEIEALAGQQVPPVLRYTVAIAVLWSQEEEPALVARLQQSLPNQTVGVGEMEITISYTVQSLFLGDTEREELRNAAHSAVAQFLPPSTLGHYSILITRGDTPDAGSKVIIGSQRWALIHSGTDLASVVPLAVNLLRSAFSSESQLARALRAAAGRQRDRVDVESMRQIRAAQGYQLSFTLLVPDPSETTVDWNIEEATQRVLVPFLSHPGIADLGNYTVSSQVFHYTDVKFVPKATESGGYAVRASSLPPMISSVESKLGSLVSQLPSLNFLVYVTRRKHFPLLIQETGGHMTDNFLVPQWGGVVFYNPPEWVNQSEVGGGGGGGGGGDGGGVQVRMEEVMVTFVKQLEMLLGVPEAVVSEEQLVLETGNLGITDWQIDHLLASKMVESVSMATTSLISLVQLLDKVKNMVISDIIQQEVVSSLHSVQECYRLAAEGDLQSAYYHAKAAMLSAERAFFDPSILELLYFPDDQKFAIYIPLFLPISIPIALSSVAAFRWVTSALQTSKKVKSD